MPVEIKELVIRAVVNEQTEKEDSQIPRRSERSDDTVEECVRQVLKILQESKER